MRARTNTEPKTDAQGVSTEVPPELWLSVFCGVLDEHLAIERGRRAAKAANGEERHRVLFGDTEPASTSQPAPTHTPYRPVGSPPWGEP